MKRSDYGLWVFGGSNGRISLNDAWNFSFSSKTWIPDNSTGAPLPRTYSAVSPYAASDIQVPGTVIFGGFNFDNQKLLGDVWLFYEY